MQEQGFSFDKMSNLESVSKLYLTDFGKFISFPFKVTLTSFQSISIISQILFLFNLTFSEVNVPIILKRWMIPAVLLNFMGI